MEIHFILVRPVVPENVGFVCRSIKNMGFSKLRVVGSDKHLRNGARHTAYESREILEGIESFDSLDQAVKDMDLVIGTTGKKRKLRYQYLEASKLNGFLEERQASLEKVAIVFGSESDGMTTDEEKCCDMLSSIPMAIEYPSINLSHSVMIYAYELSKLKLDMNPSEVSTDENKFKAFKEQTNSFLEILEIGKRQPGLYQQIKDKMLAMKPEDITLFMSTARYLRNHLKK